MPLDGIESINPCVYGCLGSSSMSCAGPLSIISPAYITARFSQIRAAPMSWVIRRRELPAVMLSINFTVLFLRIVSNPVVGSSAMRRPGFCAIPIEIKTRLFIPRRADVGIGPTHADQVQLNLGDRKPSDRVVFYPENLRLALLLSESGP